MFLTLVNFQEDQDQSDDNDDEKNDLDEEQHSVVVELGVGVEFGVVSALGVEHDVVSTLGVSSDLFMLICVYTNYFCNKHFWNLIKQIFQIKQIEQIGSNDN